MGRTPHPSKQELASVAKLPAPKRYEHFVKRVADLALVWGVRTKDGWAGVGDDSGDQAIPVWPREEYAQACVEAGFPGHAPASIEIHAFVDRWLPGMASDGMKVAVFPTANMQGVVVEPERLAHDIQVELGRIE